MKKKKEDIRKELKVYQIGFVIINILFYIVISILVFSLFPTSNQNQKNSFAISYPYLEMNFMDNFTQEEESMIRSIVRDLDPKYSQFIKQINFTKDWDNIGNFCGTLSTTVVGCNYKDRVLIYYNDYSKEWMQEAVCHEIFHSIITSGREEAHKIIYDLGYKGVCFK